MGVRRAVPYLGGSPEPSLAEELEFARGVARDEGRDGCGVCERAALRQVEVQACSRGTVHGTALFIAKAPRLHGSTAPRLHGSTAPRQRRGTASIAARTC